MHGVVERGIERLGAEHAKDGSSHKQNDPCIGSVSSQFTVLDSPFWDDRFTHPLYSESKGGEVVSSPFCELNNSKQTDQIETPLATGVKKVQSNWSSKKDIGNRTNSVRKEERKEKGNRRKGITKIDTAIEPMFPYLVA